METQILQQPIPQRPVFSYAGFWKRFAAYIIDQIIISILAFVIVIPFLAMVGLSLWSEDLDLSENFIFAIISAYFSIILFIVIGQWLYYALMESIKGATLGKMVLGIIVTDMQGNRISFGRATGRYFAKIISSLILSIGYIMAGFTQQKQGLHDIITGCLVINK
ncbi:MAG: RDD family protein [Bacteroidota bacterium]|nr:RDD family protein [Bacteroidota bacterium]